MLPGIGEEVEVGVPTVLGEVGDGMLTGEVSTEAVLGEFLELNSASVNTAPIGKFSSLSFDSPVLGTPDPDEVFSPSTREITATGVPSRKTIDPLTPLSNFVMELSIYPRIP